MFTANDIGDYRVCFFNEVSASTEKMVDFELAVRYSTLFNDAC